MVDAKKYSLVFIITIAIFATAFYLNSKLNQSRVAEINAIQDKLSLDIAASETQFNLLPEQSCDGGGDASFSPELGTLIDKLSFMENNLGAENSQVLQLKKYYFLLESKDYLLVKKLSAKCGWHPITILYFYSNNGDCADCEKEGYVLTDLRQTYPEIRVYSFDYNLDFSIISTMRTIFKIHGGELPALVLNGKAVYGFTDEQTVINTVPELKQLVAKRAKEKTSGSLPSTATTTKNY
ncbi:MAG: hypothetical protein ACYC8S_02640 [Minisyncoccota bacterium]